MSYNSIIAYLYVSVPKSMTFSCHGIYHINVCHTVFLFPPGIKMHVLFNLVFPAVFSISLVMLKICPDFVNIHLYVTKQKLMGYHMVSSMFLLLSSLHVFTIDKDLVGRILDFHHYGLFDQFGITLFQPAKNWSPVTWKMSDLLDNRQPG